MHPGSWINNAPEFKGNGEIKHNIETKTPKQDQNNTKVSIEISDVFKDQTYFDKDDMVVFLNNTKYSINDKLQWLTNVNVKRGDNNMKLLAQNKDADIFDENEKKRCHLFKIIHKQITQQIKKPQE